VEKRPAPVDSSTTLPREYGGFVLFDQIGQGGMAKIFLGRRTTELGAHRLIVVKQILPMLSGSGQFAKLFIDEAKLSAQLTHGNIVQVLDLGRAEDQLYIAMEYVEGFDLRELLRHCAKQRVPLPVEFTMLVTIETLRALDYAHRKRDESGNPLNIVHRDVSPSNVLISLDGEIKLCDFGIARALGSDLALPSEVVQGKAGYMSPEAANGEPIDARADIFSVGVILWEMLAGRRLYKNPEGGPPTLQMAAEALIPDLPKRDCPNEDELHGIVKRALTKDPRARFGTAGEMLQELEQYARGAKLLASPLRFGDWLLNHFGEALLAQRRGRERASHDWEKEGTNGDRPSQGTTTAAAAAAVPVSEPAIPSTQGSQPFATAAMTAVPDAAPAATATARAEEPPPSSRGMTAAVTPGGATHEEKSHLGTIVGFLVLLLIVAALIGVFVMTR